MAGKRLILVAALVLAAVSSAPARAGVNLVSNGSFEVSPITNIGQFETLSAGDSTSIPGWTVTDGNVDYIGS